MKTEFENIIRENVGVLHKLCRVYTFNSDEYQELMQEMLIQLWHSVGKFRGEAKLSTFVYRIAINTALGFRAQIVRDKKRYVPLDGLLYTTSVTEFEKNDQVQKLYSAIRELKLIDRAIVSLYLDDKSYEETGEILGISTTNVATRLMRLKKKLTEKLAL